MPSTALPAIDTLWYTRCPVPTALGIAVQQGHIAREFAGDGPTLRSVQDSTKWEDRASHFDHRLDNSFRQGGNLPAIWTKAAGRDTRLVGLTWTDEYQAIITLPGSGILTAKDLKGRRVSLGLNRATTFDVGRATSLRGYLNALATVGLGKHDLEIVDIAEDRDNFAPIDASLPKAQSNGISAVDRRAWSAEIKALVRGEVDAVYVKAARGAEIAALIGAHVVIDIGNHPDPLVRSNNPTPRTFTVDGPLLDRRPDLVARILARVLDAGDWAAAHPAEARAYVGREIGATDEWVEFAYGDVHLHLGTELRPEWLAALADWKTFLFTHGFIATDFDVAAWVDPAPLAEALRLRGRRAAA
jgi:ABC-type nitrate/sulfonate/bicarbonate transport system substrate-binding protein